MNAQIALITAEVVSVLPIKAGVLKPRDVFPFLNAVKALMDVVNVYLSRLVSHGATLLKHVKLFPSHALTITMIVEIASVMLLASLGVRLKRLAFAFLTAAPLMTIVVTALL